MVRDRLKDLIPKHWRCGVATRLLSPIRSGISDPAEIIDRAYDVALHAYYRYPYTRDFDDMLVDLLRRNRPAALDYAEFLAEMEGRQTKARRSAKRQREYRRNKGPTKVQLSTLVKLGVNDVPTSRLDALDIIEAEQRRSQSPSMDGKTTSEIWG
jgi:hypothetical protein